MASILSNLTFYHLDRENSAIFIQLVLYHLIYAHLLGSLYFLFVFRNVHHNSSSSQCLFYCSNCPCKLRNGPQELGRKVK